MFIHAANAPGTTDANNPLSGISFNPNDRYERLVAQPGAVPCPHITVGPVSLPRLSGPTSSPPKPLMCGSRPGTADPAGNAASNPCPPWERRSRAIRAAIAFVDEPAPRHPIAVL